MKYEKPQLIAETPAISAIQTAKLTTPDVDSSHKEPIASAYQDWE